ELVRGRQWQILGMGILFFIGVIAFSIVVNLPLAFVEQLDNFIVSALLSCVVDVAYIVIGIALVLHYLEARQEELGNELLEAATPGDGDEAADLRWSDDAS